jgi:hypothetical protein
MTRFPGEAENNAFFKVEDYVFLAGDQLGHTLAETVDPFIAELDKNSNNAFSAVCINLIDAYNSSRIRESSLVVANRTFRVGQFIAFLAGAPEPNLPIGTLLISKHDSSKDVVFERILDISHKELNQSPTFKEVLYNCRPSIDPTGFEEDILDLFAGFALLSMNLGHHAASEKLSMEELTENMAGASDTMWDDELHKWLGE